MESFVEISYWVGRKIGVRRVLSHHSCGIHSKTLCFSSFITLHLRNILNVRSAWDAGLPERKRVQAESSLH